MRGLRLTDQHLSHQIYYMLTSIPLLKCSLEGLSLCLECILERLSLDLICTRDGPYIFSQLSSSWIIQYQLNCELTLLFQVTTRRTLT